MALSKVSIDSQVEGFYTLDQLLELLGSPPALKKALKDLKDATAKVSKERKEAITARAELEAATNQATAERIKLMEEADAKLSKTERALEKLQVTRLSFKAEKEGYAVEIKAIQSTQKDWELKQNDRSADLDNREKALSDELAAGEKLAQDILDNAARLQASAKREKASAKKMLDDANAKMSAMKKALG